MRKPKDYTQEIILVFVVLVFAIGYLIALDKTGYIEANKNCNSIQANLELINTEATPERLDLENYYFSMWCNNL